MSCNEQQCNGSAKRCSQSDIMTLSERLISSEGK